MKYINFGKTPTLSQRLGYTRSMAAAIPVGRVGALAVALGIGAAVTTGYGCPQAWADTTGSSTSSSSSSSGSDTSSAKSTEASDKTSTGVQGANAVASEATSASSSGATTSHSSTQSSEPPGGDTDESEGQTSAPEEPTSVPTPPSTTDNGNSIGTTKPPAKPDHASESGKHSNPSAAAEATSPADPPASTVHATQIKANAAPTTVADSATVAADLPTEPTATTPTAEAPVDDTPTVTADPPAAHTTPATAVAGIVANVVKTVLSPFTATGAPGAPAQSPMTWTLLAFARRELETIFTPPKPSVESAPPVTTGLTVNTNAAAAAPNAAVAPTATASVDIPPLTEAEYNARFSGAPGLVDGLVISAARVITSVLGVFGIQLSPAGIGSLLASETPPWYLTLGLNVQKTEIDGMPVYTLSSAHPSGEYVVGIHGGAFTVQPTLLHWLAYSSMVRDTGATVVVPMYPLANEEGTGGTAGTVIPQMADFISSLVEEHGSQAVSVYGDSAGGGIALASVQELVRRGAATPGHMVLLSPVLDLTMSNPNIALVKDPVLRSDPTIGPMWAGGLSLTDSLVSPIYGSLDGLPPTWVYAGSAEVLGPDVLRLQDMAIEQGADFGFTLRSGQIHDWALPFLPDGQSVKPDIYQQLGLLGADKAAVVQPVAATEAATFTGQPSLVARLFVTALRVVNPILRALGIELTGTSASIPFISDGNPPFFLTSGLEATSTEYDGWKVWTLTPANPTGKVVVAVHGGAFISQVNVFQWWTYTDMARQTGATVVVPLYPLANKEGTGGTAKTVIPTMADFIADQVGTHGKDNVSVLGDSVGGTIGLTATQELVRRCNGDETCLAQTLPGSMVLISPFVDLSMGNPNIANVDDPLLNAKTSAQYAKLWAAGLGTPEDPDGTKNPLASPLFGSLEDLPPITVYGGSLDMRTPDVLVLQQKAASTPGADFTFELRNGEIHDWIIFAFLPDATRERPGLYDHLGITNGD